MSAGTDFYNTLLNIPGTNGRRPDHYRLLGLKRYEADPEQIRQAAQRTAATLRAGSGKAPADVVARLVRQVEEARDCLLSTDRKRFYDSQLGKTIPAPASDFQGATLADLLPPGAAPTDSPPSAPAPVAAPNPMFDELLPPGTPASAAGTAQSPAPATAMPEESIADLLPPGALESSTPQASAPIGQDSSPQTTPASTAPVSSASGPLVPGGPNAVPVAAPQPGAVAGSPSNTFTHTAAPGPAMPVWPQATMPQATVPQATVPQATVPQATVSHAYPGQMPARPVAQPLTSPGMYPGQPAQAVPMAAPVTAASAYPGAQPVYPTAAQPAYPTAAPMAVPCASAVPLATATQQAAEMESPRETGRAFRARRSQDNLIIVMALIAVTVLGGWGIAHQILQRQARREREPIARRERSDQPSPASGVSTPARSRPTNTETTTRPTTTPPASASGRRPDPNRETPIGREPQDDRPAATPPTVPPAEPEMEKEPSDAPLPPEENPFLTPPDEPAPPSTTPPNTTPPNTTPPGTTPPGTTPPGTTPPGTTPPATDTPVDPQVAAEVNQALGEVRMAIRQRQTAAARTRLDAIDTTKLPRSLVADVQRVGSLLRLVEGFWNAVNNCLDEFDGNEELQYQDTRFIIVDPNPDDLTIKLRGQLKTYRVPDTIPLNFAYLLAETWLDSNEPSSRLFLGAIHAVDPDGHRDRARALWDQAAQSGKAEGLDELVRQVEPELVHFGPGKQAAP